MNNNKPWGGRFTEKTAPSVDRFCASIPYDWRLYSYDIQGSITHAGMLAHCRIITSDEAKQIKTGLEEIKAEIDSGNFEFKIELEDIHMNIESALIERIGSAGEKLHTARSRNDQVALDMRLYLRDQVQNIISLIEKTQEALLDLAEKNITVIMPGYTHLQRAKPVLFSHHLLAYFEMFKRDRERLKDAAGRINQMPLGAGALAGTSIPIDREWVARELEFDGITANSMDSVSDRDFCLEFLATASILMMHLSRFCEELILWNSTEFGFVEFPDEYTTGSSMMPQKKNPDVAELIRGKTGRVYGNLTALLTVMKGLPLTYNRDMQEDKEPVFDTVDTLIDCLTLLAEKTSRIKVDKDKKMAIAAADNLMQATDLAEYLVKKGEPFRSAHHIIGKLIQKCFAADKELFDWKLEELKEISDRFEEDVYEIFGLKSAVLSKVSYGSTAPDKVKEAIQRARQLL
jgi:argininosuccinate lyase